MSQWTPIRYRDFWDVPRIFLVSYREKCFLFDCAFDEATEDYPDSYRVYIIPEPSEAQLAGSWDKLHEKAIRYCGDVSIGKVPLDSSKRCEINTSILDELVICGKAGS